MFPAQAPVCTPCPVPEAGTDTFSLLKVSAGTHFSPPSSSVTSLKISVHIRSTLPPWHENLFAAGVCRPLPHPSALYMTLQKTFHPVLSSCPRLLLSPVSLAFHRPPRPASCSLSVTKGLQPAEPSRRSSFPPWLPASSFDAVTRPALETHVHWASRVSLFLCSQPASLAALRSFPQWCLFIFDP